MRKSFLAAVIFAAMLSPAHAQMSAQATFIPSSAIGGTANALTIASSSLPAVTQMSDLLGVPLRFIPPNANTGAATLNVASLGNQTIKLKTPYGLVALNGGEEVPGEVSEVVWDGTVFEQDVKGIAFKRSLLLTSTQQYQPFTTMAYVDATVVGGGGAGGGTPSTSSTQIAAGGGGGGGGVCRGVFTLAQTTSNITVNIGAGGTGVANGTGGSGGNSTLGGTLLGANGGSGGTAGTAGGALSTAGGAGGTCGTGTGAFPGSAGGIATGFYSSGTTYFTAAGYGAPGFEGSGAALQPITAGAGGNAGTSCGAGGSGATSSPSTPGNETGGAGHVGCAFLNEYDFY